MGDVIQLNNTLKDVAKNGKERPWRDKKQRSLKMAEVFRNADLKAKAARMRTCAETLVFNQTDEGLRLAEAYFCQVRLCPMCTWRRSLKISFQNKQIIQEANRRQKLRWLFLTLTVRNVESTNLLDTIDDMMKAWNRFAGYKRIKDNVVGWFRGLEITRDSDRFITQKRFDKNPAYYRSMGLSVGDENPNYNTYHPHFHVLMCVKPTYFSKKANYIDQEEWTSLWKRAMQIDYKPIVDIRIVKARRTKKTIFQTVTEIQAYRKAIAEEKAVMEVSKYPVKDSDVIDYDDMDTSVEVVRILDNALSYKRLIAYGGLLKGIRKELQLSDVESEDADLIHIEESKDEVANECMKVMAHWNYGLNDYVIEDIKKLPLRANNGSLQCYTI